MTQPIIPPILVPYKNAFGFDITAVPAASRDAVCKALAKYALMKATATRS